MGEPPTFQELIESAPGGRKRTSTGWATVASGFVQAGLIALALLYPVFETQSLQATLGPFTFIAPLPPPGPPPDRGVKTIAKPVTRLVPKLEAPRLTPRRIEYLSPADAPPDPSANGPASGPLFDGGVLGGILNGNRNGLLPPAPIRIGGDVMEARRLDQTMPVYPPEALKKGVMGTVSVVATISTEGRVINVRVVSGDPLLVQSALDAIAQFRYEPTYLNGMPAEVDTTIDIIFRIQFPPAPPAKKQRRR
ncbi:MAG TPA: energy transducer TonB [Candidatus Acidoferrum sp.]|nr:energy transducer TonB [Candidatus Acidoferrum sp.]